MQGDMAPTGRSRCTKPGLQRPAHASVCLKTRRAEYMATVNLSVSRVLHAITGNSDGSHADRYQRSRCS